MLSPALIGLLYGSTVLLSAVLLLVIQPILAKAILPWFGGSAGVWTTSMLFFQVFLLLGYWYAHLLATQLTARVQTAVHVSLLLVSLVFLPIVPSLRGKPLNSGDPVSGILTVLFLSAGLPYLLLAATSPLVQSWYALRTSSALPYRLFAVSNLGSLFALLAYPFSIEPMLSGRDQLLYWSRGYVGFVVLAGFAAVSGLRSIPNSRLSRPASGEFAWHEAALWIALAACPSVLFLAIANHLSQDVAPVPFLWVLPFAIYLLTFVLCFDRSDWYQPAVFRWILPIAWGVVCYAVAQAGYLNIKLSVLLLATALFVCCMFCHGELARAKPEAHRLTGFYLSVAIGGALGGVFVGLIAPAIFTTFLELPLALLSVFVLALWLLYGLPAKRIVRIGAVTAAAVLASVFLQPSRLDSEVHIRNFYGTLHTETLGEGSGASESDGVRGSTGPNLRYRALYNGTIQHGVQFLWSEQSRIATTYYGRTSGVAIALATLRRPDMRVGVVGLGAGTLAAYGKPGDHYRFYEINPDVIRISRSHFRYLAESGAKVDIVQGDARLSLEKEAPAAFDVLALDAFSGDSIPIHLLTREAFALYFRHLKPDGALAIHVTNKHLELAPVVKALALDAGAESTLIYNTLEQSSMIYASSWMIVTRNKALAQALSNFGSRVDLPQEVSRVLWTDDYSNLLEILK